MLFWTGVRAAHPEVRFLVRFLVGFLVGFFDGFFDGVFDGVFDGIFDETFDEAFDGVFEGGRTEGKGGRQKEGGRRESHIDAFQQNVSVAGEFLVVLRQETI